MFHRLSQQHIERIRSADMPSDPVNLDFDAIRFLGSGVAFEARSPQLERLRAELRDTVGDGLTRQDAQKWRPHVTVQNKAGADSARQLFQLLSHDFTSRTGRATGLLMWEYMGGPWRLEQRLPFSGE
jgi:2'-5' RNA ligase